MWRINARTVSNEPRRTDFRVGGANQGLPQVEPGRALGREVKLDGRMLREPGLDRWRRMGGGVVEDDVQLAAPESTGQALHEAQENRPGVPRGALADDPAAGDLKGGVQAGQGVAGGVGGAGRRA